MGQRLTFGAFRNGSLFILPSTIMSRLVQKEEIPSLQLVPAFVDNSQKWREELQYATRLGNEFKGKTAITFETTQGPCEVETTVWSVTESYLQLKGGVMIPLESVIQVHY